MLWAENIRRPRAKRLAPVPREPVNKNPPAVLLPGDFCIKDSPLTRFLEQFHFEMDIFNAKTL